jgi:hypothetical protein
MRMFENKQGKIYMKRFLVFLSRRSIGFLFTLLSVLAMNCWQQILPNFDYDNSYVIVAAKNISAGHGYTLKTASAEDLSKSRYEPLNKYPPGYSLFLVFIHSLLRTDWVHAVYFLNAAGLTAMVLLFRKLLFQLEYPAWIVNVAVLFFGFFKQPFHEDWNSDIFAVLFFILGLVILIDLVKTGNRITGKMVLASVSLGLTAYMKYLYIPLAFVPVISLFFYGYLGKEKDFQLAAIKGMILITGMICLLFLFQYLNSGTGFYINPSKTGFFPEQLISIAPIVPASFIDIHFISTQVYIHSNLSYKTLMKFWSVINIFLLIWLVIVCIRLYRDKIFSCRDFRKFYAMQVFLFSVVLFSYLLLLTITKSKHYGSIYMEWVYAQELRYYAIFSIFLVQFSILLFLNPGIILNKTSVLIFRLIMITIFIEEVGHGAYYCVKQMVINKSYGIHLPSDQRSFFSLELTNRELAKNKNLVFCSNLHVLANMSSLENISAFYDPEKLNHQIKTSVPLTLIIALSTKAPAHYAPILSNPDLTPDFILKDVSFYILHLPKSAGN